MIAKARSSLAPHATSRAPRLLQNKQGAMPPRLWASALTVTTTQRKSIGISGCAAAKLATSRVALALVRFRPAPTCRQLKDQQITPRRFVVIMRPMLTRTPRRAASAIRCFQETGATPATNATRSCAPATTWSPGASTITAQRPPPLLTDAQPATKQTFASLATKASRAPTFHYWASLEVATEPRRS